MYKGSTQVKEKDEILEKINWYISILILKIQKAAKDLKQRQQIYPHNEVQESLWWRESQESPTMSM